MKSAVGKTEKPAKYLISYKWWS